MGRLCFVHRRAEQGVPAILLAAFLCGCSASRLIDLYAADYRDTAAAVGDAQLLQNVLRAKDDLPIHFNDLSIIHGSIQWTAGGTVTLPFAHFTGSETPSSVAPTLNTQTAPTFDLGTLDTQDFTKGILSKIDVKIIKAMFDQGVDPRLIMLLFFSDYQTASGKRFLNNMSCDTTHETNDGDCRIRAYDYLKQINRLVAQGKKQQLQANIYEELTPVGGRLGGALTFSDNLGDLATLDVSKYRLKGNQFYSISEPQIAICYEINHRLFSLLSPSLDDRCRNDEVVARPSAVKSASLAVRSPYDMLQYLGQVLRFQEENGPNRCITLDPDDRTCDTGEVLFQVNGPYGPPVVTTNYAGRSYSINARSCNKNLKEHCDYSLQVFAILELLLNANKAAKDIIATPRVQTVP